MIRAWRTLAAMTVAVHKAAGIRAELDTDAGLVALVFGWLAPAAKHAVSPCVVPVGVIEVLDVKLGRLSSHVRLVLRNGGNTSKVSDDFYAFVPNVRTIEPWLDALRLAMAEAVPVHDFIPPPPSQKPPTPPRQPVEHAPVRPPKKPSWLELISSWDAGKG